MDPISKATDLIGLKIRPERTSQGASALEVVVNAELAGGYRLIQVIREGFPVETVQHIVDSGRLNLVEVDRVVLPRKTLANRKKVGALTAEQSDRLLRVARVIAAAEEVFGNEEKAGAWLRRPTTALDGEQPLNMLDTEEGAREVETLLTRISHGIAA